MHAPHKSTFTRNLHAWHCSFRKFFVRVSCTV